MPLPTELSESLKNYILFIIFNFFFKFCLIFSCHVSISYASRWKFPFSSPRHCWTSVGCLPMYYIINISIEYGWILQSDRGRAAVTFEPQVLFCWNILFLAVLMCSSCWPCPQQTCGHGLQNGLLHLHRGWGKKRGFFHGYLPLT